MHRRMPLIGEGKVTETNGHDKCVTPITNTHITRLKTKAKLIRLKTLQYSSGLVGITLKLIMFDYLCFEPAYSEIKSLGVIDWRD